MDTLSDMIRAAALKAGVTLKPEEEWIWPVNRDQLELLAAKLMPQERDSIINGNLSVINEMIPRLKMQGLKTFLTSVIGDNNFKK